jgi:hypothetical protein
VWKKKYFEEKKKTVSLEERCNQLRYEVEVIHKKILSSGDGKGTQMTSTSRCNINIFYSLLIPTYPPFSNKPSLEFIFLLYSTFLRKIAALKASMG